jgi:hypothetical protein
MMTSCDVYGGRSGIVSGFAPSCFDFSRLLIISPLLHACLSTLPEVFDSHYQAAPYHILSLSWWGFISDPALDNPRIIGNHMTIINRFIFVRDAAFFFMV